MNSNTWKPCMNAWNVWTSVFKHVWKFETT